VKNSLGLSSEIRISESKDGVLGKGATSTLSTSYEVLGGAEAEPQ